MPEPGQRIGSYELVRRLGGGAFGEVWLARHADLDVHHAMKIPLDRDYVRQLRLEGKIQFGIRHANIVETIDLNSQADPPYFVMEYVEGSDLRQRINDRGKLPEDEALGILRQMLAGLAAAHANGVVHHDLKPENCLITTDDTLKLTDFGLGRVGAQVAQSLLLSGSMISAEGQSVSGTFEYMSPEQKAGEEATPHDDVFAAGIIACELLTGSRPSAVGAGRLMERAAVRPGVAQVVETALEQPQFRYPDAGAMLAAVEAIAGEDVVTLEAARDPGEPPPLPEPPPLADLAEPVPSAVPIAEPVGPAPTAVPVAQAVEPGVPSARVVGPAGQAAVLRITWPGRFAVFDITAKVQLDGRAVGQGSFVNGFQLTVNTTPGVHVLSAKIPWYAAKQYTVELPEAGEYRVELRADALLGNFHDQCSLHRIR